MKSLRPAPPPKPAKAEWRRASGGTSRGSGRRAEWVAAAWLMLHGWQILGFRLKSRNGEIDILARRGKVLAVVEVKRRATIEAAMGAIGAEQHARLLAAGRAVLRGRPGLAGHQLRIDMVALAPKRFPRHLSAISPPGDGFT